MTTETVTTNTRIDNVTATITLKVATTDPYPGSTISEAERKLKGCFSMAEVLRWVKQTIPALYGEFNTAFEFKFENMKDKGELPAEEVLHAPKALETMNALVELQAPEIGVVAPL